MARAVLLSTAWDETPWVNAFAEAGLPVSLPEQGELSEASYAMCWKPRAEDIARLSNVKVLFSLGAGVDHLLNLSNLPDVPIVRVVDEDLSARMSAYLVSHVLDLHLISRSYRRQQQARIWQDLPQPSPHETRIGFLGFGTLAQKPAHILTTMGFAVSGWSRSEKHHADIKLFHGSEGLAPFLSNVDILISLLPASPATKGFLNIELFEHLQDVYLINAGRGQTQISTDILTALDRGYLTGAVLDVFEEEPLELSHPFWTHPDVTITPHIAACSSPSALVPGIIEQIANFEAGRALVNVVDPLKGY